MAHRVHTAAILAVLCGSVLLLIYANEQRKQVSTTFFMERLSAENASEDVYVGDEKYTVVSGLIYRNGKVVEPSFTVSRLAYAKMLARRSPFLSTEGISPEDLHQAAVDLRKTAHMLSELQADSLKAFAVNYQLYPVNFLFKLAELEHIRQNFLARGGSYEAQLYEVALWESVDTYQRDIAAFRRGFEDSVPKEMAGYVTEKSIVDRKGILEMLGTLRSSSEELLREINARSLCYRGFIEKCEFFPLSILPAAQLPTELSTGEEVRSLIAAADGKDIAGPFIEIEKSACVERAALFIMDTQVPRYVGDLRLLPVEEHTPFPFVNYFSQHDIPYIPHTPLIYYACPDTLPDYGAVGAVLAVRAFASSTPGSFFLDGLEKEEIVSLEEKLLADSVVRETDAKAYISSLVRLRIKLPVEVVASIDALFLRLAEGSEGLITVIRRITSAEHGNLVLQDRGAALDRDALFLFYTRSAFLSLFLSNTLAAEAGEAIFAPNKLEKEEMPYAWYSELPRTDAVREEIIRSLKFYRSSHTPE